MKLNYKGIENCCQQLEGCLSRIKAIDDDVESQISKIKGGSIWAGPASESFVKKANKTLHICKNMEQSLHSMINYIRLCSENYQQTDKEIERILSKFNF